MRHITPYQIWEAYQVKDFNPIQQEFMKLFLAKCDELGIQVNNLATERQQNNNTWIINLSPSEVLKLIQESGWQQYLEGIRRGKVDKLLSSNLFKMIAPALDRTTSAKPGIAHWIISNDNVRQMFTGYWHGGGTAQPSSQRTIIFEELSTPEKALGRFYNELVLAVNHYLNRIDASLKNDYVGLIDSEPKIFDFLSAAQIKLLMKKYPNFSWYKVFATADLHQQTFKDITEDPEFSKEAKQQVFANPNWADYDKVEDVLGDW